MEVRLCRRGGADAPIFAMMWEVIEVKSKRREADCLKRVIKAQSNL